MTISEENTSSTTDDGVSEDSTSNIEASIGGVEVAGIGVDVPGVHDAAAGEVTLGLAGEDTVDTLEDESVSIEATE